LDVSTGTLEPVTRPQPDLGWAAPAECSVIVSFPRGSPWRAPGSVGAPASPAFGWVWLGSVARAQGPVRRFVFAKAPRPWMCDDPSRPAAQQRPGSPSSFGWVASPSRMHCPVCPRGAPSGEPLAQASASSNDRPERRGPLRLSGRRLRNARAGHGFRPCLYRCGGLSGSPRHPGTLRSSRLRALGE
jgi:hypothetical protein